MSYRDTLRADLIIDEGEVAYAYQDSRGFWTIAVGRLIDKRAGGRLRPDEIALLLKNDMADAIVDARALFPNFNGLSANRKAALANMAFNLGQTKLAQFKRLRAAVAAKDFQKAAAEMLQSAWAKQVGARADRLAKLMKKG
jgi:lysozyme